ncbi:hypothetical protein LTR95_001410 [Oleoguttula sp. CCFEE 5521]
MEERPEEHNFDQRHDGPLQVDTAHNIPRRDSAPTTSFSPISPAGRDRSSIDALRSTGKSRVASQPDASAPGAAEFGQPRRSTTGKSKTGARPSVDFDRRYDGPYGRPSLTMTRQRSSQNAMSPTSTHRPSEPNALPVSGTDGEHGEDHEMDRIPPPRSEETSVAEPAFEPEPPPLNYTLRTRKFAIAWFWTIVVFDSAVMPLALYYGLWYGLHEQTPSRMSANTVFSIVTAAIGGLSIFEYFVRFWRLWKKNSTCRVIGARRMYLDSFHWNYTLAWLVVMIELIVGSVQEDPPIRLLAMPCPTMLYVFGTELLILDTMRYFSLPAPFRLSSVPKGAQVRPGIYSIIEDVVAVDGSGGTDFREALNKRYEASHIFRAMLRRLGLFWSLGAQGFAVVCTILVFTLQKDGAYAVGWAAPFIWAGVWTLLTIWYVKKMLKVEAEAWAQELAEKTRGA